MEYKLYVCDTCKQAFYYTNDQGKSGICRNCLNKTLHERNERIIFRCPECHRHYDGTILLDNPQFGQKKFKLQLGKLLCPKDAHALEMQDLKEDIYEFTRDLMAQFSEVQKPEITEESEFIAKVNRLKEDVLSDIQQKTQKIMKKPKDTLQESQTTSMSPSSITEVPTKEPGLMETDVIAPVDFSKIIPTPPPFTPYADEFWQFYFKEKNFSNPQIYPGHNRSIQKIRHFLEEISRFLFNAANIDLTIPVYERLSGGKVIYIGDTHGSVKDTDKIIEYCVSQIERAEESGREIRIIFLGDYVDRNSADIHNVLYILAFALQYPLHVRLLRGNHEEVTINMQYGFWENLNDQLPNSYLFNDFEYLFMNIPLIHVIGVQDHRIMALHGGLPFYDQDFEEMPEIPRIMEGLDKLYSRHSTVDEMDILSQQILWSDPVEHLPPNKYFLPNPRGIGFTFSKVVFDEWCRINGIDRVIRGHEVFVEGHREYFGNRLFSLFSNSDYVGRKIEAKILEFDFAKKWDINWTYQTIQHDL